MPSSVVKTTAVDLVTRALKTTAQALVSLFGATTINVLHLDWKTDLGIAAGAGVVSLLQNFAKLPEASTAVPTTSNVVLTLPSSQTAQVSDVPAPVVPEIAPVVLPAPVLPDVVFPADTAPVTPAVPPVAAVATPVA